MWRSAADVGRFDESRPPGASGGARPPGAQAVSVPCGQELVDFSSDAHRGENENAQQNMWAGRAENAPAACVPGSHAPPVATEVAFGVALDLTRS